MVELIHLQNESLDLLFNNGTVIEASVRSYEIAFTFGGVIWLWPLLFLFTLMMVQIKTQSPTMVAIYAILGNLALGSLLPAISHTFFASILIITLAIWLFSLFVSPKIP